MKALAAAKRFELKDYTLLIYAEGYDKPLRFTPRHLRRRNFGAVPCAQGRATQFRLRQTA